MEDMEAYKNPVTVKMKSVLVSQGYPSGLGNEETTVC